MTDFDAMTIRDIRAWHAHVSRGDRRPVFLLLSEVDALLAALDSAEARAVTAEAERDRLRANEPPCDGGCDWHNGPEETCSAHGRPVAEVWRMQQEALDRAVTAEAKIAEAWDEGLEASINADLGDWENPPDIPANPYRAVDDVPHESPTAEAKIAEAQSEAWYRALADLGIDESTLSIRNPYDYRSRALLRREHADLYEADNLGGRS